MLMGIVAFTVFKSQRGKLMKRFVKFFLIASSAQGVFPFKAHASDQPKRRSFLEWCEDKSISAEARRTVEELLLIAGTKDCKKAFHNLKSIQVIGLGLVYGTEAWKIPRVGPQPAKSKTCQGAICMTAMDPTRYRNLTDISPLEGFTWIKGIDLTQNNIKDLNSISHLKNIKSLWIRGNPMTFKKCPLPWIEISQCSFEGKDK